MKSKGTLIIALSIVIIIIIAWFVFNPSTDTNSDILVKPQFGKFTVTVTATGELQAKNSVKIYGPMRARMVRVYEMKLNKLIPEGTVVKKGDFVADLDRSELSNKIKDRQLEIQKAESQYTLTQLDTLLSLSKARDDQINLDYAKEEAKLKNEQSKYEAPAVRRQAEIDYEKAVRAFEQAQNNYKTNVKQAQAKMREVEAELSQHKNKMTLYNEVLAEFTVRAPADGMVIYHKEWNGQKKTEGSMVRAWDPVVATLPDLSIMESITYVNEVDIKKIQTGQKVDIGLDADPEKQLKGEITEIANMGEQRPNSTSKVFEVKILINTPDTTLRPSMTTSNEITIADVDSSLSIPLECIHNQDSLSYVIRQNGSGLEKQEVELGLINDDSAIIENGITIDDELYFSTPTGKEDLEIIRLE
ncbi:MAG: HlyD family efflux transporter periplasmic adaptor subunit [Bacteroidota bacterium]